MEEIEEEMESAAEASKAGDSVGGEWEAVDGASSCDASKGWSISIGSRSQASALSLASSTSSAARPVASCASSSRAAS